MAELADLGLSEYESRTYRSLLQTAPATARKLSDASGVPMGRVYDVLESLETLGLVRSQPASRPKRYVAVEPAVGLDRLLAERKRELADRVDQYESVAAELEAELESRPPGETFWTVAIGPHETVDLLAERIDAATDRVAVAAPLPGAGFDVDTVGTRITDSLEAAAERGVAVRVLGAEGLLAAVPEEVYGRYADGLADRGGFALRTSDYVDGSFVLVDGGEVCIEVPNPLGDEALAMIDLKDGAVAADALEAFERRWEEAAPL